MKIYVAGSWSQRMFIEQLMTVIKAGGSEIAVDWTRHEMADDAYFYASEDMAGVKNCDIFVLVDPATVSRGKFTEFGMALALGKKIIILMDREQSVGSSVGVFGHLKELYHRACSFTDVLCYIKMIEEQYK